MIIGKDTKKYLINNTEIKQVIDSLSEGIEESLLYIFLLTIEVVNKSGDKKSRTKVPCFLMADPTIETCKRVSERVIDSKEILSELKTSIFIFTGDKPTIDKIFTKDTRVNRAKLVQKFAFGKE